MDEPDRNTLPDPELNPLLNPLLAAHMGRWAEVYFTTPPEKRSQAVAELIRELQHSPSDSVPAQVMHAQPAEHEEETAEVSESHQQAETLRSCSGCGYRNSEEQKFCGMCGAVLQVVTTSHLPRELDAAPREASWSEPAHSPISYSASYLMDPGVISARSAARIPDSDEPAWRPPENQIPHFAMEPEPDSHRFRLYAGVVLVVLIGLLVYMARRGTTAISSTSGPQPVPSKVIPPAPSTREDAVQQPRATPSESSADRTPPSSVLSKNQRETTRPRNRTADSQPTSQVITQTASSSAIAPEPGGGDELATAERYLNAGPGRGRDSSEAALWLWKAVGKGNPAATMVLSDLYLRGDGVPKNCDQARLLLNAAARKGSKAAGERLRNWRAFGCE
jgi:hypothetical protein